MISSLQVEKTALGGLIKNPQVFGDIDFFISETDFYNEVHSVIYSVLRQSLSAAEEVNKTLLAQKIKNCGISFKDDINIFEYIDAICFTQISQEGTLKAFQELKSLTVRRELHETGAKIQEIAKTHGNKPIDEVISACDTVYGSRIQSYAKSNGPVNIFEDIEAVIEEIGNNPPDANAFLYGPFETINYLYGSLLRPGNITMIGARTSVGKTAFSMYYLIYVAEKYGLPLLWLDFSEMRVSELQMRAVCMFTGGKVPYHALETGEWRRNEEWTKLTREVWPRVKKIKVYYEDIGNKTPMEIVSLIRRFSCRTVGRDKPFLIGYDYFKPFSFDPKMPEYKEMGHFIQTIKSLITNEIQVPFWSSIQLNRMGITNNKTSEEVDDSENSISLSDRITQQTSHTFILRQKLVDEIAAEGLEFGNLKLIPVKTRHLGKGFAEALQFVKLGKGRVKRNYVNIYGQSFYFEDKGDLIAMVKKLEHKLETKEEGEPTGEIL